MTDDDTHLSQEEEHTLLSASDLRCEVTGLTMFLSHGGDVYGVKCGVVYIIYQYYRCIIYVYNRIYIQYIIYICA